MSTTVDTAPAVPVPRRTTLAGRTLLVCRPDLAPPSPTGGADQAPLPFDPASAGTDPEPDLEPARRWVTSLGRVIVEVLTGRRPAAQLAALLDERSVAYLAAWANRGTLRPRSVGVPRLSLVTASRIEAWMRFQGAEREFVAVLCLRREGERWRCRDLRVIAPEVRAGA